MASPQSAHADIARFNWLIALGFSALTVTAIVSGASASAGPVPFEQLMEIPLRKCQILLLSHEERSSSLSKSDDALVEIAIEKLHSLDIPLQYWVKRAYDSLTQDLITKSLNRNQRMACATFLIFLEARMLTNRKNNLGILKPLPWVAYTLRSKQVEHDFTILGFQNTPVDTEIRVKWTMVSERIRDELPIVFPENLFFLRLSKLAQNKDTPQTISVTSVGSLGIFCRSGQRLCILWHNLKSMEGKWWNNPEEFYRKLAPRSSYCGSHAYNFNRAKIVTTARQLIPPGYWNAVRKLDYRETQFPSFDRLKNYRCYGTIIGWIVHSTWQNLQVIEAMYNGSMTHFDHSRPHKYVHGGHNIWPEFTPGLGARPHSHPHQRLLAIGLFHVNFFCVDSLEDPIDFISMFNPMDTWTWLSVLLGSVAMSLAFWRLIRSPMFSLVVIFFAQGDAEANARFNFLIVIWSLLGFLLTSGYSCMIASIFVVPPKLNHPSDIGDLYLQGYKLAISSYQVETRDYGTHYCLSDERLDNGQTTSINDLLKRLDRDAVEVEGSSSVTGYHDKFVGIGKACGIATESRARVYVQLYSLAYSKFIFFTCKKALTCTQMAFSVGRPGSEILRGGVQLLHAIGVVQFWEMVEDRVINVEVSAVLANTIIRRHPFYRYGYFFHIVQDEELYIFSIRNAQGKMVFYFGLICAAFAVGALCIEILYAWLKLWYHRKNIHQ